jgi:glycosyltransferase involved in cell wall biosynthesis
MKIVFIGFSIPSGLMGELAKKDVQPGFQGFNHQWSIVDGIEKGGKIVVDLISFPMISDYPRNKKTFVRGGKWSHTKDSSDVILFTFNVFPFKLLLRMFLTVFELVKWCVRNSSEESVVMVYSSQISQLLAVRFASVFFRFTSIAVLTDPISMGIPGESVFKRLARILDRYLQKSQLRNLDGLIVLTKSLALDYAPKVPYLIVEGIAPAIDKSILGVRTPQKKFTIAYAGMLKAEYDITLLLNSVKGLDDVDLWIFGKGDMTEDVISFSNNNKNVKYFGFLEPSELRKILVNADCFISHLPGDGWYTKYKFPSKILEYMALGKPVISSRYPTIPHEYSELLVWIEVLSPEGIMEAIKKVQAMPENERLILGKKCRNFAEKEKSIINQGVIMSKFIKEIVKKQQN